MRMHCSRDACAPNPARCHVAARVDRLHSEARNDANIRVEVSVNLEILIEEPYGQKRVEHRADSEVVSVGRDASCSLCLADDHISRRHVLFYPGEHTLRVEDVSTNGTLAGERVLHREAADVPYGTPISLGMHTIYVRLAQEWSAESGSRPAADAIVPEGTTSCGAASNGQLCAKMGDPADSANTNQRAVAEAMMSEQAQLRREIHRQLLRHLDLVALDPKRLDDVALRPRVLAALHRIVAGMRSQLPSGTDSDRLVGDMADEALGLGPL